MLYSLISLAQHAESECIRLFSVKPDFPLELIHAQKTQSSAKNLPAVWLVIRLAQEMASGLAGGKVQLSSLPR